MKKRFIPLLALLLSLCIIVPVSIAQIMAAATVQVKIVAIGGSVKVFGVPKQNGETHGVAAATEDEPKVSGPIVALPSDGYVFKEWTVDTENVTITDPNASTTQLIVTTNTPETVTLTANFVKTVTVTTASNNDAWGTVTADKTAAAPGESITLTAAPKEGYRLDGWTVSYTDGSQMEGIFDRGNIFSLAEGENSTATLTISAGNTEAKPLKVTAHFEDKNAGHFLSYAGGELQSLFFQLRPSFTNPARITGWSNNANEDIVVVFDSHTSKDTLLFGLTTFMGAQRVADGVTFKFDSDKAEDVTGVQPGQKLALAEDDYSIGFTMTDKDRKVKHGTVLLQFPGRALVEADHGTVQYGEKTYNNGDVITFEVGKEVTISAAAADGYRLKEWVIDGATLASSEDGSVTFTVPDKFFSIKPVFEETQAAVTVTTASNNDAWGTVTADKTAAAPGESITLTAAPKEGYRLDGWTVSYTDGSQMEGIFDRGNIFSLAEGENSTATLTISAGNTEAKPLKVTAHFEDKNAGHFLSYAGGELQSLFFQLRPSFTNPARITGWSNNANEDIVVVFDSHTSKDTLLFGLTTFMGAQRVADGVTFKFDSDKAEDVTGVQPGQKLALAEDDYSIGFTMTDKDRKVKHGTVLLQFPGRALVEADHGTVQYGEKTYNNGDVITFEVGKEVTISAAAADGYRLKEWVIDGATLASSEDGSVTFTVPDKFFSIKPVFEEAGDAPQGPGCATVDAEHGKLVYNGKKYNNGDVIAFTPGETVTVFARVVLFYRPFQEPYICTAS